MNVSYNEAKKVYAALGVDTEAAIEKALSVPISVHCWQGDDLTGFISGVDCLSDGGLAATGNFPGKAKNANQLRADMDEAFRYIPGVKKVNLHSVYAETTKKVDLADITPQHFDGWIEWANQSGYGVDFNPTCFSHPMAASGFTLASPDKQVRDFWISHVKTTRLISEYIGKKTGKCCVHNIWIPDGTKDTTVNRMRYREILVESLDEIFKTKYSDKYMQDTLESKLFGLGSESYVVGSHDFYLLYTATRGVIPCLDMGHFHPTESVADKMSSMLLFFNKIQIHTSRGVRWDSDHVVNYDNETVTLMQEIARANAYDRMLIALDYFDASINRIFAWGVGARATRKAILNSLLEPIALLRKMEAEDRLGRRLALLEEAKTLPMGAVWEELCQRANVPGDFEWQDAVEKYEWDVLRKR